MVSYYIIVSYVGYLPFTGFAKLKVNTVKIKMHSTNKKLKRNIFVDDITAVIDNSDQKLERKNINFFF